VSRTRREDSDFADITSKVQGRPVSSDLDPHPSQTEAAKVVRGGCGDNFRRHCRRRIVCELSSVGVRNLVEEHGLHSLPAQQSLTEAETIQHKIYYIIVIT
jgi:hypothetical protein